METTLGTETVTTTIQYVNGKPVFMQALGFSGGKAVNIATKIFRNAQGIIEKIIIKNPAYLATFLTDSIIYIINYSVVNNRYTSLINNLFFKNGATEYDSTYLTYDASGMVSQATKLINNGSGGMQEGERNEFTYDNGNLIRCKNYILSSMFLEQNVIYDTRINPMGFGKEWVLIGSTRNNRKFEQSSLNNATTISYNQNGTVSTTTSTYTYNSYGYPSSKTDVLPNGSSQTSTYTYLNR
jgi:YD repeat-containing protein